jgi:hypothetical protein
LLLALAGGCGGHTADNFPVPSPGEEGGLPSRLLPDASEPDMARPTPPSGGDDGGARDAAAGEPSLLKVSVEIKNPTMGEVRPAHDRFAPSVDVLIDSSMATAADTVSEVQAVVTKMGAKMSAASAKLDETKVEQMGGAAIHHFTDTPVDIAGLDSGTYQLKVNAKTVGGVMAMATVDFIIDAGPVIRIDSPGENKYYRSSATVDVTITDPLFGPVAMEAVSMWLGQTKLTLPVPSGPDKSPYNATIEFSASDPPLEGDQLLTVRAKNSQGTETVARRKFVADNKGPVIANTIPAVGALIGRVITVSAQVTDEAGVLDSSVVAVIAHGDDMYEVKLQPAPAGSSLPPNTYQALFDTARLPITALYPSISFRASDIPGNQSSVGHLLSLDNTPPISDLDPPKNFHMYRKVNTRLECSWAFDPLGSDAVNDLDNVNQLFDIRARIEDRGNTPFGPFDVNPIAGIDDSRVQLLILDDTTQALVVDTNNDGKCDSINPSLTPTTTPMSASDALLINMVPLTPAGSADFRLDPTVTVDFPPTTDSNGTLVSYPPCEQGTADKAPEPICDTSLLSVTIPSNVALNIPATYTVPPVIADKKWNLGRQFDALGNHVTDGWICLAVAAADKLGNLQVSRPIRVCVDKDGMGNECGPSRPPPPNCTGTLTALQPKVVVDVSKPCLPWALYNNHTYRASF